MNEQHLVPTNRARADVLTAIHLTKSEKNDISRILETSAGKTLAVNFHVMPEVIAGISIRIEDQAYDATLRTTIEFLKERLFA